VTRVISTRQRKHYRLVRCEAFSMHGGHTCAFCSFKLRKGFIRAKAAPDTGPRFVSELHLWLWAVFGFILLAALLLAIGLAMFLLATCVGRKLARRRREMEAWES
jgi:hypothetical protein